MPETSRHFARICCMKILFWIAYVLTVAEFIASPVNVLRGSEMHLRRFTEVKFPLALARGLAVLELFAVTAVIAGIRLPLARLIGGITLVTSFLLILLWAIKSRRPATDLLGLAFFMVCALIVSFY
jgi:uncharacterized membrane protein YphA (DoxX/SURF4 family)